MKEKFRKFVAEKRAVSPVIGVVLMVAVVVILAAVIGAFVLGLGGSQETTPQAAFSYDASSNTLTMSGGDTLNGANVYLVIDGQRQDTAVGTTLSAGSTLDVDAQESLAVVYDDGSGESAIIWQIDLGGVSGGGGN